MKDWTKAFHDDLWLKPDHVGAEEVAFIRKALSLRRGNSVLDAPCGAGRIAVHLARAGCRVTGVDVNRRFVERARRRFRREGLPARFVSCDLRSLDSREEFHAAFNWSGSFGYFSDEENFAVLCRLARALRPGGRLLIDQRNREFDLRHWQPVRKTEGLEQRVKWDAKTQRYEAVWIFRQDGRRRSCRLSIRAYTPRQFQRLFEKAGLAVEGTYGSIGGEPYVRSSKRMIMVGRKRR